MNKLVLIAALLIPNLAFTAEIKKPVELRQAMMAVVGHNMGSMVAMIKGQDEFSAQQFMLHASSMNNMFTMLPQPFEPESFEGETKAKQAIWQNTDDFNQLMSQAAMKTKTLMDASADGDQDAIKAAFGEVGKTCKGCHKTYRAR